MTQNPLEDWLQDSSSLFDSGNATLDDDGGNADQEELVIEDDDFYEADTLALVLPRITAMISVFAVVCVALEAWSDLRADQTSSAFGRGGRIRSSTRTASNVSTITHIQLWYQVPLFCHALAFALGTTPAPNGVDIWGAVGNTQTCEAQAFLLQFGIFGVLGWDMALSTAYLMMVRYLIPDFRLQGWVKYYHMVIWPSVLLLCIWPLVKGMYNFNHSVCWLESLPNDCVGDECIRGAGAPTWQTIASISGVIHLIYSVGVMITIYRSIRGLENRRNRRFQSSVELSSSSTTVDQDCPEQHVTQTTSKGNHHHPAPDRQHSRAVGVQGMLYASGMLVTTLPTALYIILWNAFGVWSPGFGTFATTMTPLMGYINFIVFMRNRKVEGCGTRYGKLLRRAHAWLFDYQWHCECHCHCLPKHVGDQRGRTASTTSPGHTPVRPNPYSSSSGNERKPTTSSLPKISEEDVEEADDDSSDSNEFQGTCGAWELALKQQDNNNNNQNWVSELGASEFDSINDDMPEQYCHQQGPSPSRPVQLPSQAEGPTSMPKRLESCRLGDDEGEQVADASFWRKPMHDEKTDEEANDVQARTQVAIKSEPLESCADPQVVEAASLSFWKKQ